VRVEGWRVCPRRGVTRSRRRRGCSGNSGPSCAVSRTPCRCRRIRCGASGPPRTPRWASPRDTTGTPCARAPQRGEPTGRRPPLLLPSASRQRTDSDGDRGCPGAPVPGPGSPHRRRAPAAVRRYPRHASFMHTDLRLCAFRASSGRFEMVLSRKWAAACGQEQRRVPKTKAMAKLSGLTVALDTYALQNGRSSWSDWVARWWLPGGRPGWSPCLPSRALGRARRPTAVHCRGGGCTARACAVVRWCRPLARAGPAALGGGPVVVRCWWWAQGSSPSPMGEPWAALRSPPRSP